MKNFIVFACRHILSVTLISFPSFCLGQDFSLPDAAKVPPETLQKIEAKKKALRSAIGSLQRQGLRDPWMADIDVYYKAASWIVKHNEFFNAKYADWTIEALDRGLLRAKLAASGNFSWVNVRGFPIARAYRSRIDGSVQPFAVTFPKDYGNDSKKKWRLDVVLHGRDKTLNEVKFLHKFNGESEGDTGEFIRLDVYGRGNNAYRWAGEEDVLEAIGAFLAFESQMGRSGLIDRSRLVLRGFSMGGAGTWHLGLHMPDRWCVIGPGAGFTTTHGYINNLPPKLPPWQERCLSIYDAVDYAENVFNVPVVSYGGSKDKQLQASLNIQKRLEKFPFSDRMKLIVAPGLGHQFPAKWRAKAEAEYAKHVAAGREEYPKHVRFVTYTLKFPSCDWVEIVGLQEHYTRTLVDAQWTNAGFEVKTANVSMLHLTLPQLAPPLVKIKIDGQKLAVRPWVSPSTGLHVYLQQTKGKWKSILPQRLHTLMAQHPRKSTRLQGPIDDAFTDSFLCVRGTGKPWNKVTDEYSKGVLAQFQSEWSKYWRGDLPVKDDVDVTDQDIANRHLILFGDPSSNSLIAHVLDGLPLSWTSEKLEMNGKSFASSDHIPVMIHPNPLNANRYVVLNSGHTFHTPDYVGTNALLYPRLGDFAVLQTAPTKDNPLQTNVRTAGLFDEHWHFTAATSD